MKKKLKTTPRSTDVPHPRREVAEALVGPPHTVDLGLATLAELLLAPVGALRGMTARSMIAMIAMIVAIVL